MLNVNAINQQITNMAKDHGTVSACARFDGNTKAEEYRAILKAIDDGDPVWYDSIPNPLSGEWADDPTPSSVLDSVGVSTILPEADQLLTDYEVAFGEAYEDVVVRWCKRHVG